MLFEESPPVFQSAFAVARLTLDSSAHVREQKFQSAFIAVARLTVAVIVVYGGD